MAEFFTVGNCVWLVLTLVWSLDYAVTVCADNFLWKTPTSELEALREILRALPVMVGPAARARPTRRQG